MHKAFDAFMEKGNGPPSVLLDKVSERKGLKKTTTSDKHSPVPKTDGDKGAEKVVKK